MVRIYILILLLLMSGFSMGQTVDSIDDNMVTFIEDAPFFNGDIKEFVRNEINYADSLMKDSLEGNVVVSFWIDTLGKTYNHKIVRGLNESLNTEALRVSKLINFDEPAKQKGKPITVKYILPIEFKLPWQDELPPDNHSMPK